MPIYEIDVDKKKSKYIYVDEYIQFRLSFFAQFLIILIILTISIFFFFLDFYEHPFIKNIRYITRIKKNLNNYTSVINEKIAIEKLKTKQFYLSSTNKYNSFTCIDMGEYYVAGKINSNVFLPEFIRRGNGGIWKVLKGDEKDEPAEQFCNYISSSITSSIICGNDMLNKIGYTDYLDVGSPCNNFLKFLFQLKN